MAPYIAPRPLPPLPLDKWRRTRLLLFPFLLSYAFFHLLSSSWRVDSMVDLIRVERDRLLAAGTGVGLHEAYLRRGGKVSNSSHRLMTTRTRQKTHADVAGANMDHNLSVSHPCISHRPLMTRAFLELPPSSLSSSSAPSISSSFGHARFVMRSGYRMSGKEFAAIGLTPRQLRGRLGSGPFSCSWVGLDYRVIPGSVHSTFPGEHHMLQYETVIHTCMLNSDTKAHVGGSLFIRMDGQEVLVVQELSGAVDPSASPPHTLGFCSFPMYRQLNADTIEEWLKIAYQYLGVSYFVLSDGGSVTKEMMKVLLPFLSAGVMEVVDIRGQFKYESKHNVLTLNDCLYRMRYVAEWVLFIDFDEFLYVPPPATLKSLLRQHKDVPYLSFGSLWWSTDKCRPPFKRHHGGLAFPGPARSPLSRMRFHWPHFYCEGQKSMGYDTDSCINFYGHRKVLARPSKVRALQVHRVVEPLEGGKDLPPSQVHLNHFQGLARADLPFCRESFNASHPPLQWWVEDEYLADIAFETRKKGPPRSWALFGS